MSKTVLDPDRVDAYDYELPRELIAQHPVENRCDSRLMLLDRQQGKIEHFHVRDLTDLLRSGDALVLNNTKVIPARIVGSRTGTGGRWEGLYLRDGENSVFEVLSKTRGRISVGETISLRDRDGREAPALTVLARLPEGHLAVRPLDPSMSTLAVLEQFGRVPIPPYIRDGKMVDRDLESYQTVYAKHPGSVAAPTAGLHFTPSLIRQLQQKGVATVALTLHVGLGTFRPVSTDRFSDHPMHSEWGELTDKSAQMLRECRTEQGRVVSVGTTSVRVLESAAISSGQAYQAWSGQTNLLIRPPYDFQATDALMTNFHLPRSTLLALVSAFAGRELVMEAYRVAIEQRYRFFSYGDCMLIV